MAKIIRFPKYRQRPSHTLRRPEAPIPPQPFDFDFVFDQEQLFIEQLIITYLENEKGYDIEGCEPISAWSSMMDCFEMQQSPKADRLLNAFRIGFRDIAIPQDSNIQNFIKDQIGKCKTGDPVFCVKTGAIFVFFGAY